MINGDAHATDALTVQVSVDVAARALGISRKSLYRLIEQDKLRTVKVGSRRLVRVRELERFAAAMERATS